MILELIDICWWFKSPAIEIQPINRTVRWSFSELFVTTNFKESSLRRSRSDERDYLRRLARADTSAWCPHWNAEWIVSEWSKETFQQILQPTLATGLWKEKWATLSSCEHFNMMCELLKLVRSECICVEKKIASPSVSSKNWRVIKIGKKERRRVDSNHQPFG